MRLLTFTNLYPSADQPRHGIFVEERLRQLVASGKLGAQVLALRPSVAGFVGGSTHTAQRHGIAVEYHAVSTLPMLTNWIDPWLWARDTEQAVRRLIGPDTSDVILDAHFLYPDGAAAVIVGDRLGVPTVLTARGSDVNVKCRNEVMRRWVRFAAARCAALITVSRALADRLTQLQISAPILEVLPNGVDLDKFRPLDRGASRAQLALDGGKVIVSVGHLVADKGHGIAIEALADLADTTLLIVGEGPERASLERRVRQLKLASRVRFLGLVPHDRMNGIYSAADVLVLASAREGMPNVLLESLACGTPAVATDVGGIGEVLTAPVAGRLMRDRSPAALREALEELFERPPTVTETRSFAARLAWGGVVDKQVGLYRKVLADRHAIVASRRH